MRTLNYYRFKIRKADLRALIENLKRSFALLGPVIESGVIRLKEINSNDIPAGSIDFQSPGHYRLLNERDESIFSFSNGPDSFKGFLYPPLTEVFHFKKSKKGLAITLQRSEENPIAFFGMRACDIRALRILEKIFSGLDDTSRFLRRDYFIIGLNCLRPNENCFCSSLGTGPEIRDCEMIITELKEHLLIESVGAGIEFLKGIDHVEASEGDLREKGSTIERCRAMIKKSVKTKDLPVKVYRNTEHEQWSHVSERCLACGNCTQVCPTCFCSSTFDSIDILSFKRPYEGLSGKRIRVWDSCFSVNFARVHGGNFRPSRRARYRHWLSHKFGYWIDQFGMIGCVGCGRCITWCPVGIDVTEELKALGG